MPQGVVDGLEVIQVQEEDRHSAALLPPGAPKGLLETVREKVTVGQVGQRVVERLVAQTLLCPLALDALGDHIRHGRQCLDGILLKRLPAEHGHHPHQPTLHDQGMTGEGHHPLLFGPFLVAHKRIVCDVVGQVRQPLFGDEADLVLPDGYPAVETIEVGVHPCAGLQLQHLRPFIKRPDSGECCIQVLDHALRAPLQDFRQGTALGEGSAHVRP